jgi:hypothetical protein
MSTIAEKTLRADQPENSDAAQRARFSQPLRRHLETRRQNLRGTDRSLAPTPLRLDRAELLMPADDVISVA